MRKNNAEHLKLLKTSRNTISYTMLDFIGVIREKQVLWSRSHAEFHNHDQRQLAWRTVTNQLCPNLETFSFQEQQDLIKTILKRWKNIRDCFLRAHRLKQMGDKRARPYIYERQLTFLLNQTSKSCKSFSKSTELCTNINIPTVSIKTNGTTTRLSKRRNILMESYTKKNKDTKRSRKNSNIKSFNNSNLEIINKKSVRISRRKLDETKNEIFNENLTKMMKKSKQLPLSTARVRVRNFDNKLGISSTMDNTLLIQSDVHQVEQNTNNDWSNHSIDAKVDKNSMELEYSSITNDNNNDVITKIEKSNLNYEKNIIQNTKLIETKSNQNALTESTQVEQLCNMKSCRNFNEVKSNQNDFIDINNVDSDQAFFNWIKPYLRKMTERQKLDFQIDILNLLKHYSN